jgi:NADPH:quinone reductase-like Zn-dependent oxidoreductase
MNKALAIHHTKPVIDRVFPFAETRAALTYLESAAHFGKIVITV